MHACLRRTEDGDSKDVGRCGHNDQDNQIELTRERRQFEGVCRVRKYDLYIRVSYESLFVDLLRSGLIRHECADEEYALHQPIAPEKSHLAIPTLGTPVQFFSVCVEVELWLVL